MKLGRYIGTFGLMCLGAVLPLTICEVVIRYKYPHLSVEKTWPSHFDSRVGWTFVPGQLLRYTNYFDFSSTQLINSLGFPDREPAASFGSNEFRVLVLGDSFVEAAQVDIPEKMPALLEQKLQAHMPDRVVKTIALGYSGSGTSNVLPFYTEIGRRYRPHLVVLVFVHNDMSNNSPVLEAIRYGWHPYHPPRLFFEREGAGFRRIDIDPDWAKHLLPTQQASKGPSQWIDLSTLAAPLNNLMIYRFFEKRAASAREAEQATAAYTTRVDYLRKSDLGDKLIGWRYPDDLFMDDVFYLDKRDMPKVFAEALEITGYAIEELHREIRADGGKLLILATEGCSKVKVENPWGRKTVPRGLFLNLRDIVGPDIPLIEFGEYLTATSVDPEAIHFSRDHMHWNKEGHRRSAEVLSRAILRDFR